MKIIFSILFLSSTVTFSQNIDLKQSKVTKLLCRSWILDYAQTNGEKISGLEDFKDKYIFKSNGDYEVFSDTLIFKGKWKYNPAHKCIDLSNLKNNDFGRIRFLDKNQIVIIQSFKNIKSEVPIEDSEYYFKPIKDTAHNSNFLK